MDLAKYAELFRTESREHLVEIDSALLALERDGDVQQVVSLFRSTHTIKGMAASMGYHDVELLAHSLETLFEAIRSGARALDDDLVALLFDGADALAQAVDDAVEGRTGNSRATAALLQRLASAADAAQSSSESSLPTGAPPMVPPHRDVTDASTAAIAPESALLSGFMSGAGLDALPHRDVFEHNDVTSRVHARAPERVVEVRLSPDSPLKGVRALLVLGRLEAHGVARAILPPQHEWSDDAFDGAFSVTMETRADDATLEEAARTAGEVARVSVRTPEARRASRDVLRHVRIDLRRLDTLLDLVGELVITRDRLTRVADTVADRALAGAVHDTARLVSALQEEVLRTRMVPVGQVFDRFPRLVRDAARDLGKDVTFVTEGRDIELDRSLLDAIGDPIVHLLRNAIDHGIETSEVRRAAGKPPSGRLVLRAARDRAAVIVQVEDDGGGIDRDAVLRRARADGAIDADVQTLTDDALLRVIARAGFSTAHEVTALSGRGVGIDVVASRVRTLGGALELRTTLGVGSVFTLRLPVTLAIVRALLVRVGEATYALPSAHVVEALEYESDSRVTLRGQEAVTLRDDVIPMRRLRQLFAEPAGTDEGAHLVVVEAGGRQTALLVDALVGQQDVVVKPYDMVRGAAPLFSGATILGDGTPALIVDLGGLS